MNDYSRGCRCLIKNNPHLHRTDVWGSGVWPSHWIRPDWICKQQEVVAFRRNFSINQHSVFRIHVSADERYTLYLSGIRIGRGNERGDVAHWFFDTYELELEAGSHCLVAIVWALGEEAPMAQVTASHTPEFILASEGSNSAEMDTGVALWEASRVSGYTFIGSGVAWGTGSKVRVDGRLYPWRIEEGISEEWLPVKVSSAGRSGIAPWGLEERQLVPSDLLAQVEIPRQIGKVRYATSSIHAESYQVLRQFHDESLAGRWTALLEHGALLEIPAHSRQRVIVDLGNYYCGYPELKVSGGKGSHIRIHWAESLYSNPTTENKGDRNEIFGKWFRGVGDDFIADGGLLRTFSTLWWEAGRYLEIEITTQSEALSIHSWSLLECRYPLEQETEVLFSNPHLQQSLPLMMRTLQMCAHETFMDCPYYEQLMYVGDSRIEALITYAVSSEVRLPVRAVQSFAHSCDHTGLTASRYPVRGRQVIPTFSLWWIAMVYDLALWRGERTLVRECLPRIRGILEAFLARRDSRGVVLVPEGWHFMDWVPAWDKGCPSIGPDRACGITMWLLVHVLRMAAELEEVMGNSSFAEYDRLSAQELSKAAEAVFWDAERQLMADDVEHRHWSQHAQCLAVLSGSLSVDRARSLVERMLRSPDLSATTIYFSHYLFETLTQVGRGDLLLKEMEPWFSLRKKGFCTTFETPEPTRSDCHAWGAHPLYHSIASVLGIRPGSFGFDRIAIRPQLGDLKEASGKVVHPKGRIEVSFAQHAGIFHAKIVLPEGTSGQFLFANQVIPLNSGAQDIQHEL